MQKANIGSVCEITIYENLLVEALTQRIQILAKPEVEFVLDGNLAFPAEQPPLANLFASMKKAGWITEVQMVPYKGDSDYCDYFIVRCGEWEFHGVSDDSGLHTLLTVNTATDEPHFWAHEPINCEMDIVPLSISSLLNGGESYPIHYGPYDCLGSTRDSQGEACHVGIFGNLTEAIVATTPHHRTRPRPDDHTSNFQAMVQKGFWSVDFRLPSLIKDVFNLNVPVRWSVINLEAQLERYQEEYRSLKVEEVYADVFNSIRHYASAYGRMYAKKDEVENLMGMLKVAMEASQEWHYSNLVLKPLLDSGKLISIDLDTIKFNSFKQIVGLRAFGPEWFDLTIIGLTAIREREEMKYSEIEKGTVVQANTPVFAIDRDGNSGLFFSRQKLELG